jgi:hypothetical protein
MGRSCASTVVAVDTHPGFFCFFSESFCCESFRRFKPMILVYDKLPLPFVPTLTRIWKRVQTTTATTTTTSAVLPACPHGRRTIRRAPVASFVSRLGKPVICSANPRDAHTLFIKAVLWHGCWSDAVTLAPTVPAVAKTFAPSRPHAVGRRRGRERHPSCRRQQQQQH